LPKPGSGLQAQLAQLRAQRDAGRQSEVEQHEALRTWEARREESRDALEQARRKLAEEQLKLPLAEQAARLLQGRIAGEREAHRAGPSRRSRWNRRTSNMQARRFKGWSSARRDRSPSGPELAAPDAQLLVRLAQELAQSSGELSRQEALLAQLEAARETLDRQRRACVDSLQLLERESSALEGRLLTLQKIQNQVEENSTIQDWIGRHQLTSKPRLWQKIRVEAGWETAVESALRERLHAMEMSDPSCCSDCSRTRLLRGSAPFFLERGKLRLEAGLKPLADYVEAIEPAVSGVVAAWLAPYYAVEGVPRLLTRMGLSPQVVLINREGHQFSRFGVSFHAPDPADTGILARQREIEALETQARGHEDSIQKSRAELSGLDRSLAEHDEGLAKLRAAGGGPQQRHHERQLET